MNFVLHGVAVSAGITIGNAHLVSSARLEAAHYEIAEAVMPRAEVEIVNKLGLHARASAKLTQVASAYKCEVWLSRNGRRVNAKSIMGVMMLAAGKGALLTIEANGEGAEAALAALQKLFADKFDEGE